MIQYERIDSLREEFSIAEMCEALEVSRSGFYAWKQRPPSRREQENNQALEVIRAIHADSNTNCYGSPRMTVELREEHGFTFSENRVARVMRKEGIRANSKSRYRPKTTLHDPEDQSRVAPNRLAELESIDSPGQALAGDITYIPTREGWLYLAIVMDLYSRFIMGWRLDEHMETRLVSGAFEEAQRSGLCPELGLFHSDRGCQYTSREFAQLLETHHVTPSMSAQGYCYDNATCESFFATLKTEALPPNGVFESKHQARRAIFAWIETFYNRRRRHSSLGYLSPQHFLDHYTNPELSLN